MYAVCFERRDGFPVEEYVYYRLEDAENHFHLFDDDDSELYNSISIIDEDGKCKKINFCN